MSRIRTIKPEWLHDDLLMEAGDAARVMSVALITLSDDVGRGRGSTGYLASQVFGGDKGKTEAALDALSPWYVELYEVRGQRYFAIQNWLKHQKIDRPSKPKTPEPLDEGSTNAREGAPRARRGLDADRDLDRDHDHDREPPKRLGAVVAVAFSETSDGRWVGSYTNHPEAFDKIANTVDRASADPAKVCALFWAQVKTKNAGPTQLLKMAPALIGEASGAETPDPYYKNVEVIG